MKIVIAAAFVAALSAQTAPVAAKPEAPKAAPKSEIPTLNTSKLWRLVVASKEAQKALEDTPAAKAAKTANEAVQAELRVLAAMCPTGTELADDKSVDPPDVKCAEAKPKTEAKK